MNKCFCDICKTREAVKKFRVKELKNMFDVNMRAYISFPGLALIFAELAITR